MEVRCIVVQADISRREEIEKLEEQVRSELGVIDILVNNAGPFIRERRLFADYSHSDILEMIDGNLVGTMLLDHLVLPGMRDKGWDGKAGPDGALWIGTMNMAGDAPEGLLYRIDKSLQAKVKASHIHCSNGLDWSLERTEMYYIDSGVRVVRAYGFDPLTGELGDCRKVVTFPARSEGVPDGMCIDEEGKIWVAVWGGSRIDRWDPLSGCLLDSVELPVAQPSSCAFGGSDSDTLFVTSAASGLDGSARAAQPLAGRLFKTKLGHGDGGIRGRKPFRFNWSKQ